MVAKPSPDCSSAQRSKPKVLNETAKSGIPEKISVSRRSLLSALEVGKFAPEKNLLGVGGAFEGGFDFVGEQGEEVEAGFAFDLVRGGYVVLPAFFFGVGGVCGGV